MHDLGDQLLAAVVARMRLAGENDLHRAFLVVDDGRQAFQIAEDERAAFVSGETPGKADGQGLRIEHFLGAGDLGRGRAAADHLLAHAIAREDDKPAAAAFMGAP